eukprot:TRINITY_DN6645_c0_g1_i1.p1 TRINITY_DN6645_c0_g1~~TRINITY_DN6645_c0_g1_i1.p1  ORF type:complete len:861 (-),score=300.25 TRINITY_DN6645_c0_g1_i1:236-2818(-)
MVDVSSFADEAFDLKAWVNRALEQGRAPGESVESHATTLVMKLQLLSQEISQSLEDMSSQALLTVPRSMREIEKVRKEAADLKRKLDSFTDSLSRLEDGTLTSMRMLAELDKVKMRMEGVFTALREAEKISKLSESIEQIMGSNDFQKIAEELDVLQRSLELLKDVPEFQHRTKNLERWQDQLEGMTRPQLLAAFNQHDTEAALGFVDVFTKINRRDKLLEHYYRCRQVPLDQVWHAFDKARPDDDFDSGSRAENAFVRWLPSFYDEVLLLINAELEWTAQVFTKDQQVVASLLGHVWSWLTPLFVRRLEVHVLHETPPPPLIAPSASFGPGSALGTPAMGRASPAPGTPGSTVPPTPQPTPSPGPSAPLQAPSTPTSAAAGGTQALDDLITAYEVTKRFASTVRNTLRSLPAAVVDKVVIAICEPFRGFQTDYSTLERKQLTLELSAARPSKTGYAGTIGQIDNSVPRVFLMADSAVDRCIAFTDGAEAEGLVKVLSDVLSEYTQTLFGLLQYLRQEARLDVAADSSDKRTASSPQFFDWSYFQGALQLLQIANRVGQRLAAFDRTLRGNLAQQRTALLGKASGPSDLAAIPSVPLRDAPERVRRLFAFFSTLDDGSYKLLPGPAQLVSSLAAAVHSLVFDSVFAFARDKLSLLPSLSAWSAEPAANPLNLPSFSLSPSEYITQVGEHLLTLPQQLAPFASGDTSLLFNPKAISHLTHLTDDVKEVASAMDDLALDQSSNSNRSVPPADGPDDDEDSEESGFAFQWISALCRGTTSLYLQRILEIPALTDHGSKQLTADISYLINVLSALGMTINDSLEIAYKYIIMPRSQFESILLPETERQIATKVAQIRKVLLSGH